MHGLEQLANLYDCNYIEILPRNDFIRLDDQRLAADMMYVGIAGLLGVFIGFAISLFLSQKYKWDWANPIIVFLLMLGVFAIDQSYWTRVSQIFMFPGRLFKPIWAHWATNGVYMLAIASLLFFTKKMTGFINRNSAD